ncbi:MAG: hypothetical protein N3A58_07470 [Spirochaetes bacterium]|nr:hypothetical protein [Spirochaetota bacterium]
MDDLERNKSEIYKKLDLNFILKEIENFTQNLNDNYYLIFSEYLIELIHNKSSINSNKEQKKNKILFFINNISSFIIFFELFKNPNFYFNYKKQLYSFIFIIYHHNNILYNLNNLIFVTGDFNYIDNILLNGFDELFFLDSKIIILEENFHEKIAKNLLETKIKLENSYSNYLEKNSISFQYLNYQNFLDKIKNSINLIKLKNLSSFSSSIQHNQYLRNFFKNIFLIKNNIINNFYSYINIETNYINVFGASPKLNYLFNYSLEKNLYIFDNSTNFSIISNIDLFFYKNIPVDFYINFDTNFFTILSIYKFLNYCQKITYNNNKELQKLNILTSLYSPYSFILRKIKLSNKSEFINIIFCSFNSIIEQIIFDNIMVNQNNFSGTSINMLVNFLNILAIKSRSKFFLKIIGSDYENLDFNFNKISHHKLYPLFYYILKHENYIKNIHSWEAKNIYYSSEKHNSYKLDISLKNFDNIKTNFIKDLNSYNNFFYNKTPNNKENNRYEMIPFDINRFTQNIDNLKIIINDFINNISEFIIKYGEENLLTNYYYDTKYNDNLFIKNLFKELFFSEIYCNLTKNELKYSKKIKKIKKFLNFI